MRTHRHTEDKLCIKTAADVHNMDKTYVSFKRADYKSAQNLAQIRQTKATDAVFPRCLKHVCVICGKGEPTSICIGKVDVKSYDYIRWSECSQSP